MKDVGKSKPKKDANKVRWVPNLNKPLPYNHVLNHYKTKYEELYLCRVIWKWFV